MPFAITAPCVADYSCVEVCPVDCIHPTPDEPGFGGAEQLYIDPSGCIDCAACVEACPVDTIHDADRLPAKYASFRLVNARHFGADGPDD